MDNIHFATLPNGKIVKVELWGGNIVTRGTADIGGYVDTDTVREMAAEDWHLLRDKLFRKHTED